MYCYAMGFLQKGVAREGKRMRVQQRKALGALRPQVVSFAPTWRPNLRVAYSSQKHCCTPPNTKHHSLLHSTIHLSLLHSTVHQTPLTAAPRTPSMAWERSLDYTSTRLVIVSWGSITDMPGTLACQCVYVLASCRCCDQVKDSFWVCFLFFTSFRLCCCAEKLTSCVL